MPTFLPMSPVILSPVSLQLDLDVDSGRNVELAQSVDGLLRWLKNIEQAFVRANFVLIARFFVDVRRTVDRESFNSCGQRNRARHSAAGAPDGLDNLPHRLVQNTVVVGF